MNSERINIWLCKAFVLVLILNAFGIRQSHALYSPVYDYPMTITEATSLGDGWYSGSVEVVAQMVTDITSLGTLLYDIATDEETRASIKQQFHDIKEQIGEDPQELFPILRDVILVVATGNTPEEWECSLRSPDSGERSHLATRGTGNAIIPVANGVAIFKRS